MAVGFRPSYGADSLSRLCAALGIGSEQPILGLTIHVRADSIVTVNVERALCEAETEAIIKGIEELAADHAIVTEQKGA